MARTRRISTAGIVYHVMNRASAGLDLFADPADYQAFQRVLAQDLTRCPDMRLCAYAPMPNHFHLLLWPSKDAILPRFMQWLGQTHAARSHAHRHSRGRGHLYQSRFKSFPVQQNSHFLKVCRYVERNPLRANLVHAAQDWNSLWVRLHAQGPLKDAHTPWPVARPRDWLTRVNQPQDERELTAIARCRDRGQPFGQPQWILNTAHQLGLESTLRPVGRPKQAQNTADRES